MKLQKSKGSLGAGRHSTVCLRLLEAQDEAGAVPSGASRRSTTGGGSVMRGSRIKCDGRFHATWRLKVVVLPILRVAEMGYQAFLGTVET